MNFQDLMMPPIVADIILIALLLLVVWIVIRTSVQAKDKENIIRLETKLDEYAKRISSLDEKLNEHGFIVPGPGDAGDRLYGTAG